MLLKFKQRFTQAVYVCVLWTDSIQRTLSLRRRPSSVLQLFLEASAAQAPAEPSSEFSEIVRFIQLANLHDSQLKKLGISPLLVAGARELVAISRLWRCRVQMLTQYKRATADCSPSFIRFHWESLRSCSSTLPTSQYQVNTDTHTPFACSATQWAADELLRLAFQQHQRSLCSSSDSVSFSSPTTISRFPSKPKLTKPIIFDLMQANRWRTSPINGIRLTALNADAIAKSLIFYLFYDELPRSRIYGLLSLFAHCPYSGSCDGLAIWNSKTRLPATLC